MTIAVLGKHSLECLPKFLRLRSILKVTRTPEGQGDPEPCDCGLHIVGKEL